jgi:hypothetical protein
MRLLSLMSIWISTKQKLLRIPQFTALRKLSFSRFLTHQIMKTSHVSGDKTTYTDLSKQHENNLSHSLVANIHKIRGVKVNLCITFFHGPTKLNYWKNSSITIKYFPMKMRWSKTGIYIWVRVLGPKHLFKMSPMALSVVLSKFSHKGNLS